MPTHEARISAGLAEKETDFPTHVVKNRYTSPISLLRYLSIYVLYKNQT